MRKIKHQLEYLGTRLLEKIAIALPLHQARAVGRALGRFTFRVLRLRRDVTLANLRQAFPEKTAVEIATLAEQAYEHFGMTMLEYLRMAALTPEDVLALADVSGREVLDDALERGKGGILLTAHFGNWEYMGAWLVCAGFPVTYMFQEQNNPQVSDLIRRYRERFGMEMVPRGMAVRGYLRALRQGRFVAMLADQDAGSGGLFLEFFGRPASTAPGPARFHLQTGAPFVLGFLAREADHHLRGRLERLDVELDGLAPEAAMAQIMLAYNRRVEAWVRRYPSQWFWMHKRWKTRPPAEEQAPVPQKQKTD